MVQGKFKSGHYRRVAQKLPGGRTVMRYKEGLPKQQRCSECQKILHGIPRMNATQARTAPKTTKRPQRPYGGVLCSPCTRKRLISQG